VSTSIKKTNFGGSEGDEARGFLGAARTTGCSRVEGPCHRTKGFIGGTPELGKIPVFLSGYR